MTNTNTNTNTTTTQVEQAHEALGGKIWRNHGKVRLYLRANFKKHQKVFIDYDEERPAEECKNFMADGALKAFTDVSTQPAKWNVNASKQVIHRWMEEIADLLQEEVCETWQEVAL